MDLVVIPGPSRLWLVLVIGWVTVVLVLYNPSFWIQSLALSTVTARGVAVHKNGLESTTAKLQLNSEMTQSVVHQTTAGNQISDSFVSWGVTPTPTKRPGTLAGHPVRNSSSGALHAVVETGRDRRGLSFNNRFHRCNERNRNNLNSSIADSCVLNLKLAPMVNASLDFETLDQKLTDAWVQATDDENTSFGSNSSLKYILLWHEKKSQAFGEGRSKFLEAGCHVNNCYITTNRSLLASGDVAAVLLHLWWTLRDNAPLPQRKDFPNARMILWAGEAPIRCQKGFSRFWGLVDYIVSYRRDADVVRTRGSVIPLEMDSTNSGGQLKNFAANKTKMAAWFVSNCHHAPSLRNLLTNELQRHGVAVDIFGRCGQFSCPREGPELCYQMLESHYKFYFSFENSLCNHYVTEKFYNILRYDVVPVTYGLGHELTGAPKDAYVDALDFPTVKALAEHLLYLDANDDAYNQYFRWKQYYKVNTNFGPYNALCEVCAALTPGPAPPVPDQYRDLESWYSEGQCVQVATNDRLRAFLGLC